MSGVMDYGWDTSDEEGGMEIDLNPKSEESPSALPSAPEVSNKEQNYDPSEPTEDYDPSEPTKDFEEEEKQEEREQKSPPKVSDYDPAEPTMSDEEEITSPGHLAAAGDSDGKGPRSPAEDKEEEDKEEEEEDGCADGRWDSQAVVSDNEVVNDIGADSSEQGLEISECAEDESQDRPSQDVEPESTGPSPSVSPKPHEPNRLLDTDDNTQTSVAENLEDNFSDVPDVTFDESDFVLEKEPFDKDKGSGSDKLQVSSQENSQDKPDVQRSENEEEERERTRRQEEIDSRNEEALVDLFREESDPDKIDEEAEQPQKKTKKKVGSKKLKKKGKKVKKGQGKKGSAKTQDGGDERFVEIRKERHSLESWEEGELEGEAESIRRKLREDRLQLELYDKAFESQGGLPDSDEQREPGEIVEIEGGKKRGVKKKDKKEKKKKKSRREVATIEEGAQEDDSQKFPSFLAGFFVQDEDIDENVDIDGEPMNQDEVRHFSKDKNYRKRHDSAAEDSVKSFEQDVPVREIQEVRGEEGDHRRVRRHEERRHESRERRNESRDTREVRREREHRHDTPRDRERERGRAERERAREKERHRERERELVRERNRRSDVDERLERRRHRSRSRSQERRRKSKSHERRSRSRDRSSRHRRHRSRDRSGEREIRERDRERERERERSKRRHRDRSREREPERWVRRASASRSRSPHRRSERASSNKENREESSRRRHHAQQDESESEEQESARSSVRRHHRRRERAASSSSSSSSSSPDSRNKDRHHHHHHHISEHHVHSSDEDASSDVILVEPERIVIDLDEEEDPPSRVDITHANAVDDSTTMVDGESIPPPPELTTNRSSALIEINPAPADNESETSRTVEEQDGDATPTRDELTDAVSTQPSEKQTAPVESDYDPAHPTEEPEEREEESPDAPEPVALPPSDQGPMPPDHPPPEEVRPSPPPESAAAQQPPLPIGLMGQRPPFQPQPPPPSLPPQQQPGLLPFPPSMSGPNTSQPQRFPWQMGNGPRPNMLNNQGGVGGPPPNMLPQNNGPSPGFPPQGRGLLPVPEGRPLFPGDSVRPNMPFSTAMNQQAQMMMRENSGQPIGPNISQPISAMAPLAQLTSLLPALERAKMAAAQQGGMMQPPPGFKGPGQLPMPGQGLLGKGPLTSSSNNMPLGPMRTMRGPRNGLGESTEVVDMDMSPGEDDCELELPSPNSDSGSDSRGRRRSSRRDHSSRSGGGVGKTGGALQPTAYVKALSKMIEKLTHKGQSQQPSTSANSGADRSKHGHRKQRPKVDLNDDDVPASAVDLTNKEKFMKKLHLQERVIDEVKLAIKPFYASKKISKEQYKLILRKAVPKICHSKSGNINPQKIQQLVEAYVGKMRKGSGQSGGKKKKAHGAKEGASAGNKEPKEGGAQPIRQNGERQKKGGR